MFKFYLNLMVHPLINFMEQMMEARGASSAEASEGATARLLGLGAQQRRHVAPLPFRISVGVGPRKWRHGVAEDNVSVVEDLLHLHGPIGAPANVISCNRKAAGSLCQTRGPGPRHV